MLAKPNNETAKSAKIAPTPIKTIIKFRFRIAADTELFGKFTASVGVVVAFGICLNWVAIESKGFAVIISAAE